MVGGGREGSGWRCLGKRSLPCTFYRGHTLAGPIYRRDGLAGGMIHWGYGGRGE